ncbi:unnamed protein product [Angiostrongylus costaricensis]|uniref:Very-long-chain (3R)-3-hydroxyacyl-CoA dehydratase n=1 Tax=Angiostrongylus costaricensis TaxID=334426 RepID=A0A0R3PF67_ANGCS|nr:unnamed protein product [Angiostrongylus costaricensis]
MTLLSRCCRAWMSFVLLQDIGFIWMCCNGRARFLLKNYAPEVARQHSLSVALIGTVRLLLLEYFDSGLLHACHLTLTVVYSLSMLGEMFYFESLNSSVPNIARIVVQGKYTSLL